MAGAFDHLIGELIPGSKGWLPLDDAGTPSGPATFSPPDPPALACAVMAASEEEVEEGDDALVTNTGASISPPLNSNVDNRPLGWEGPALQPYPSIISLTPSTAAIGSPDFDLVVTGTGFTADSVIYFAGVKEPTTFDGAAGTLTTGINMALWQGPDDIEVCVMNGSTPSQNKIFTFTSATSRSNQKPTGGRNDRQR